MHPKNASPLAALLRQRILVLDGAMGTMVQQHGLAEADYRGTHFPDHPGDLKGNNDLLVLTRPDVIEGIHDAYLGIGVQGQPSWGQTINSATKYWETYPLYLWEPVIGITVLVVALNLLGDAIRDAFDPKTRR